MFEFRFPLTVGRFEASVNVAYQDRTGMDYDAVPTVYASVSGDAKNFICTAGEASVMYGPCDCTEPCKGLVIGYTVTEKFGKAFASGNDLQEAMANFGIAVAAGLS